MSAALLASLFTAIAAAPVAASATATSVGTFAQGTTSTGTVTFTLIERAATLPDGLPAGPGSVTITITDNLALAPEPGVAFSGTPVTTGSTGSLGVTATVAGNVLTISWTGSDTGNIETIIVSGLKIAADATATPGPISAIIGGPNVAAFVDAASATATATATGTIQASNALTAGADTADILVTSVCPFDNTADSAVNSTATFSDAADPRAVTADAAGVLDAAGVQAVGFAAGTVAHAAGVTVTQTVSQLNCNAVLGGTVLAGAVGVIANALAYTSAGNTSVFPGENNQLAGNLTLTEPAAGFLTAGTTVSLKITTSGVLFSSPPTATVTAGNLLLTSGAASSEVQTVTLAGGAVGDTYTLSFGAATTGAIAFDATAATVDTALEGLAGIGAGNVAVTGAAGGPYTVTFGGALANTAVAQLVAVATDAGAVGPFTATVATTVQGGSTLGVALSADRTTVTLTVATGGASTIASTIVISNIRYDVASTVTSGTLVTVEATASGGKIVNPATRTNAQVGRIFTATAPLPNVNIGQNGQAAGLITIVEVTAGAFTDGAGPNNVFEICHDGTYTFTSPGPSAFVTGGVAAGNLILREGAAASTDNIVPGTPDPANPGCYYWTVWTKSTTASTVVIGSSATVGPLVNVAFGSNPGPLNANLSSGTLGALTLQVSLPIANRLFAVQVQVTAVSQPIIAVGATHALAGDIMIQETGNGQLKSGERICVEVVPNQNTGTITDAYLSSVATSDVPVATASNGVVIGAVTFSTVTCSGALGSSGNLFDSFSFVVAQQSTTGTGKIVISNIHYNVLNDAVDGPVQVNVWGLNAANIDFQRIISNARIGNPVAGTNATRLGVTQVGAFTTATKVQRTGRYVTYRLDFGVANAGKAIQVWGATKTGNDWSAFTVITTRTANASGVVYYYIRHNSATWRSYRGFAVTAGAWTPARQARWIP